MLLNQELADQRTAWQLSDGARPRRATIKNLKIYSPLSIPVAGLGILALFIAGIATVGMIKYIHGHKSLTSNRVLDAGFLKPEKGWFSPQRCALPLERRVELVLLSMRNYIIISFISLYHIYQDIKIYHTAL